MKSLFDLYFILIFLTLYKWNYYVFILSIKLLKCFKIIYYYQMFSKFNTLCCEEICNEPSTELIHESRVQNYNISGNGRQY
jgi:hypothetical protein